LADASDRPAAFAVKNTEPVTLRFYFELAWQTPLIVLLLAFFAGGAIFGLAAALTTVFSQRRQNLELKRELEVQRASAVVASSPVQPPAVDA